MEVQCLFLLGQLRGCDLWNLQHFTMPSLEVSYINPLRVVSGKAVVKQKKFNVLAPLLRNVIASAPHRATRLNCKSKGISLALEILAKALKYYLFSASILDYNLEIKSRWIVL